MSVKTMMYADNAATSLLSPKAREAMLPYLETEYANASQPYHFAKKARKAVQAARQSIAACLHAEEDEIFFTSGGSESDNWVIKGSALQKGPSAFSVVSSSFEHHALLHSCAAVQRWGAHVDLIDPDEQGVVSVRALQPALEARQVDLVSIMMANNELGTVQPLRELSEISHAHGALFHTDAVQAVGHEAIDVRALGLDFLSASAHKFNGPKGVGFLYKRRGLELESLIDGGAQEHGQRAGTENVAALVGMAVALEENVRELEQHRAHLRHVEHLLLEDLQRLGVKFMRNTEAQTLPGLLSLSFAGCRGESLLLQLDLMGFCISTGSACDSKNTQISHVLKAVGMDTEQALGTVRVSLGRFTTEDECHRLAQAFAKVTQRSKV